MLKKKEHQLVSKIREKKLGESYYSATILVNTAAPRAGGTVGLPLDVEAAICIPAIRGIRRLGSCCKDSNLPYTVTVLS